MSTHNDKKITSFHQNQLQSRVGFALLLDLAVNNSFIKCAVATCLLHNLSPKPGNFDELVDDVFAESPVEAPVPDDVHKKGLAICRPAVGR